MLAGKHLSGFHAYIISEDKDNVIHIHMAERILAQSNLNEVTNDAHSLGHWEKQPCKGNYE